MNLLDMYPLSYLGIIAGGDSYITRRQKIMDILVLAFMAIFIRPVITLNNGSSVVRSVILGAIYRCKHIGDLGGGGGNNRREVFNNAHSPAYESVLGQLFKLRLVWSWKDRVAALTRPPLIGYIRILFRNKIAPERGIQFPAFSVKKVFV